MLSRFLLLLFLIYSEQVFTAVLVKKNQWPQHSRLNVVFLDGSKETKSLVKKYSVIWLKNTNLSFQFFSSLDSAPNKTHIRVSFKHHNGSQLGNQKDLLSTKPTMNLFDLRSERISDNGAKRLILHEFGHALGLAHEFRNPNWPYGDLAKDAIIKKCLPNVISIGYKASNAKKQCTLLNSQLKPKGVLSTAYDQSSIMNYALNFHYKQNTQVNIKAQTNLSYLDHYAIQKWYPTN